jgi:hypothetical protein
MGDILYACGRLVARALGEFSIYGKVLPACCHIYACGHRIANTMLAMISTHVIAMRQVRFMLPSAGIHVARDLLFESPNAQPVKKSSVNMK